MIPSAPPYRRIRIQKVLGSAVFVMAISLPMPWAILTSPRSPDASITEASSEPGADSCLQFPRRWKATVEKGFGFRDPLIRLNAWVKLRLMRTSPSPDVHIGTEGWFYLRQHEGRLLIPDYQRTRGATSEDRSQFRNNVAAQEAWCDERGIQYRLIIAPHKHTIYPEYARISSPREGSTTPSSTDQLLASLPESLEQEAVVDLRAELIALKPWTRLYHRTDTHWNPAGAYAACRILGRMLVGRDEEPPGPPSLSVSAVPIRRKLVHGGDLAKLMNLSHHIQEAMLSVEWPETRDITTHRGLPLDRQTYPGERRGFRFYRTRCPQGEFGSAIIFHDSFGIECIPWLARHFQEAVFVWDLHWESTLVESLNPEWALQLVMERNLHKLAQPPQ